MTTHIAKSQALFKEVEQQWQSEVVTDDILSEKLAQVKVFARDPRAAPDVYNKSGLLRVYDYAFSQASQSRPKASLEAARIIANALLLQDSLRPVLAEDKYMIEILRFYSQNDYDHEFVGARIIFLLTYTSVANFNMLVESHGLLSQLHKHLVGHAERLAKQADGNQIQMATMALTESLKLLFNTINKLAIHNVDLSNMQETLQQIVIHSVIPQPALEQPIAQALNALAFIEQDEGDKSATSTDKPTSLLKNTGGTLLPFVECLITLLDQSVKSYTPAELESKLIPLLTIIRRTYTLAQAQSKTNSNISSVPDESTTKPKTTSESDQIINLLHRNLLPSDSERNKPLGHSSSLASHLLRLQTPTPSTPSSGLEGSSAGLTHLPNTISTLLYVLSDRDPTRFIHNIGYGHAAGYLMAHGIQMPERFAQDSSVQNTPQVPVNPITGQRLDAETPVDLPEMTEEEKEREAERLFVLFERLRATGVVQVENPVTAMVRDQEQRQGQRQNRETGRVEEIEEEDENEVKK